METFTAQSHGEKQGVLVKMECYTASYVGKLRPSSEIEEIRWLNSRAIDLISPVDKKIFAFLMKKRLID